MMGFPHRGLIHGLDGGCTHFFKEVWRKPGGGVKREKPSSAK
jgi:hypothetical protein